MLPRRHWWPLIQWFIWRSRSGFWMLTCQKSQQPCATCTPAAPLSEDHLAQLRTRKIENCKKELTTDLFKHGHVIGMYLGEHCSQHGGTGKSRCARPGCAAADQRHSRKNKAIDKQLTHQLLTVPNPHRTGKLQGMLLVHENMVVRLADVLAPHLGLVKDKLAVVVKVDLHHEDQKRLGPSGTWILSFFSGLHGQSYLGEIT